MLYLLFNLILPTKWVMSEDGDGVICRRDEVIRRPTGFEGFPYETITLKTYLELYHDSRDLEIWSAI